MGVYVTEEQISRVARCLSSSNLFFIARVFLRLTDADIAAASGNMTSLHYEYVYQGWRTWQRKAQDSTVEKIRSLLAAAIEEQVIQNPAVVNVLDGYKATDHLDEEGLSRLSVEFDEATWEKFSSSYLGVTSADQQAFLPEHKRDVHATAVELVRTWVNRNGPAATLRRLHTVLAAATTEGHLADQFSEMVINDEDRNIYIMELKQRLMSVYKQIYSELCPLWWDDEADCYSIDELYVTLNAMETHKDRRQHARKETHCLNAIFELTSKSKERPRFLLLEGDPGSGKTSFCSKIGHEWANELGNIARLSSFVNVFIVNLSRVTKEHTLPDYIAEEILDDAAASTKETIRAALSESCLPVLLVLDGYDELHCNNSDIEKLFKGQIYRNATVLLTSRFEVTNKIKKYFDLLLKIDELNDEQILAYTDKFFGEITTVPVFTKHNIKSNPLRPLVNTPLYLAFICILSDQLASADEKLETRTQFFGEVVKAILEKSKLRLKIDDEECSRGFNTLLKSSIFCMRSDILQFSNKQYPLDQIESKLGFTNTFYQRSKFSFVQTHKFNHKTLIEYLTAKQVLDIAETDNRNVCDVLREIPEVVDEERRKASMVVYFVCGLLSAAGLNQDLVEVYKELILPTIGLKDEIHYRGHYGIECLVENGDFNGLEGISEELLGKDVRMNFNCNQYCVRGAVMLMNSSLSQYQLNNLSIDSDCIPNIDEEDYMTTLCRAKFVMVGVMSRKESDRCFGENGPLVGHTVDHLIVDSVALPDDDPDRVDMILRTGRKVRVKIEYDSELIRCYKDDGILLGKRLDELLVHRGWSDDPRDPPATLVPYLTNLAKHGNNIDEVSIYDHPLSSIHQSLLTLPDDVTDNIQWKKVLIERAYPEDSWMRWWMKREYPPHVYVNEIWRVLPRCIDIHMW